MVMEVESEEDNLVSNNSARTPNYLQAQRPNTTNALKTKNINSH